MSKEEYVTASVATKMLGISPWKMAQLLEDGTLHWVSDAFNKRRKLILKSDVEKLRAKRLNIVEPEPEKELAATG